MNLPASSAGEPVDCGICDRRYLVPRLSQAVVAVDSPLAPVEILSSPTRHGNRPQGIVPLVEPGLSPSGMARSTAPYRLSTAVDWAEAEPASQSADAAAANVAGDAAAAPRAPSQLPPLGLPRKSQGNLLAAVNTTADDGGLAEAKRRMNVQQFKFYYNLAIVAVGMGLMAALAY